MKIRYWTGWIDWTPLDGITWREVPHGPGAYMIGIDQPLSRVVGVDDEGILGIGKSASLRNRLKTFTGCAGGVLARGHMAGWRFNHHRMKKHFPVRKLLVCWRQTESVMEAADEEARLIQLYIGQHLEAPPLNYSVPWPR